MAEGCVNPGDLQMSITHRQADDYDALIKASHEACNCQDCEACLKLGIQVFDWIIETDNNYRRDMYADKRSYDPELEKMLAFLMIRWHENCQRATRWAEHHEGLNFKVNHFEEFKNRCEEAAAIVESLKGSEDARIMSEPLINLRDEAIKNHRDGQTAAFF